MSGYEFKIVEWPVFDTLQGLADKLTQYGKNGWQLSTIHRIDPATLLIFLQRPIGLDAA